MPDSPAPAPQCVVLIRDLLFGSKVTATSRAAGIAVKIIRDPARLTDFDGVPRLVLDLALEGALDAAVAWKTRNPQGQVTGFLPHVAGDLIAEARRLGVDRVMSNGAFNARVEEVLRGS